MSLELNNIKGLLTTQTAQCPSQNVILRHESLKIYCYPVGYIKKCALIV